MEQVNDKAIIAYVKESIAINIKGERKEVKTIEIPAEFKSVLLKNKLLQVFEQQNYTTKKEIIIGITSAKQEATKIRRIEKALEFLKGISI